jgi:hypothetical protein
MMHKPRNMADPYESMRGLVSGTTMKIRYHSSGNDGDHIRGQAFYEWESMFPLSVRVLGVGVEALEGPGVDVVRNPSVQMADWLGLKYNSLFPSSDLLIIDGSAPWWGGPDTTIIPEAPLSVDALNLWRAAIVKVTALASMIVVPWFEYATYLREECKLPAMFVPDFNPDDARTLETQIMGWGSVLQAAILRPYTQAMTPENT